MTGVVLFVMLVKEHALLFVRFVRVRADLELEHRRVTDPAMNAIVKIGVGPSPSIDQEVKAEKARHVHAGLSFRDAPIDFGIREGEGTFHTETLPFPDSHGSGQCAGHPSRRKGLPCGCAGGLLD